MLLGRLGPYLMLAPAAFLLLAVAVYPLFYSLRLSLDRRVGSVSQFIGLENYSNLLSDPRFWESLKHTLIYCGVGISLELILGMALAIAVNESRLFAGRLRIIFLLPMIAAPVVAGVVWRLLYVSEGPISFLASKLGFEHLNVLGSSTQALPAVILVDVWQWTPFVFLFLLAGLQSLPDEPYEAARMDGASRWQIFTQLTLPLLKPVILVVLLIRVVDGLAVFDQVFVLTNGGPGTSTEVLGLYAYNQAFTFAQIGYGAAITVAMLVTMVIICVALTGLLRDRRRRAA